MINVGDLVLRRCSGPDLDAHPASEEIPCGPPWSSYQWGLVLEKRADVKNVWACVMISTGIGWCYESEIERVQGLDTNT